MTGKDLIDYIIQNNLENREFVTSRLEAALKCNVGTETLKALIANGTVKYDELYLLPEKE
jgi:hypothetical protein